MCLIQNRSYIYIYTYITDKDKDIEGSITFKFSLTSIEKNIKIYNNTFPTQGWNIINPSTVHLFADKLILNGAVNPHLSYDEAKYVLFSLPYWIQSKHCLPFTLPITSWKVPWLQFCAFTGVKGHLSPNELLHHAYNMLAEFLASSLSSWICSQIWVIALWISFAQKQVHLIVLLDQFGHSLSCEASGTTRLWYCINRRGSEQATHSAPHRLHSYSLLCVHC